MVRMRLGIAIVAAVLGVGAALGAAACGEDREGDVQFEGGTTGTTGTGTTGGEGTVTAIETVTTPTAETETSPDGNGGATAPDEDSGSGGAGAPGEETVEAEP
jgi:hypothetical protein